MTCHFETLTCDPKPCTMHWLATFPQNFGLQTTACSGVYVLLSFHEPTPGFALTCAPERASYLVNLHHSFCAFALFDILGHLFMNCHLVLQLNPTNETQAFMLLTVMGICLLVSNCCQHLNLLTQLDLALPLAAAAKLGTFCKENLLFDSYKISCVVCPCQLNLAVKDLFK